MEQEKHHDADEESVFSSVEKALKPLKLIAGVTAGISASAFVLGWVQLSEYFRRAGASWVMGALPASALVHTPIPILIAIGIIAPSIFFVFIYGKISGREIKIWAGVTGFLAFCSATAQLALTFGGSNYAILFQMLSAFFIAIFLCLLVAFVYTEEKANPEKKSAFLPMAGVMFVVLLLMFAQAHGNIEARRDFGADSRLAALTLSGAAPEDDWRMVRVVSGDKWLVVNLKEKNSRNRFRIVSSDALDDIESTTDRK